MVAKLMPDALGVGKINDVRSAVFRAAHRLAKYRISANRAWHCYRRAFRDALRREWDKVREARAIARAEAAEAALPSIPQHFIEQAAAIRLAASYEPWTFVGHANFHAAHAAADALVAGR